MSYSELVHEVVFDMALTHLKVMDVHPHHNQVREKLHLNIEIGKIKLRTPQERLGERKNSFVNLSVAGGVEWNFQRDFEFSINELQDLTVKTILESLKRKNIRITVCCQHDEDVLGKII